jgi:hypothetical protein
MSLPTAHLPKRLSISTPGKTPPATPTASSRLSSESKTSEAEEPKELEKKDPGGPLQKSDVDALFSGAPSFILERGHHGHFYPQVYFPYDSDMETSDLIDRKVLAHESFAVCTLHARLPKYEDRGRTREGTEPFKRKEEKEESRHWTRAAFDVGQYERPNMLGQDGKEPGTVGYRYFMELPVGDELRIGYDSQAFQLHGETKARLEIIRKGAHAWEGLGVRNVTMKDVVERLQALSKMHEEIAFGGQKTTILDRHTSRELYTELFTKLIIPPKKNYDEMDPYSMKMQIESLVKVLAVKHGWIDFSHGEWRVRLGQLLWATSRPAADKHLEPATDGKDLKAGSERKWVLLQIVLAAELLLRLDAVLNVAVVRDSPDLHVSPKEIHRLNELRTTKTDWDLILARRFLDHLKVEIVEPHYKPSALTPPQSHSEPSSRRGSAWLISKIATPKASEEPDPVSDLWDCILLPRRPERQLDGLCTFATTLKWPNAEIFAKNMSLKVEANAFATPAENMYAKPIQIPQNTLSAPSSYFGHPPPDLQGKRRREHRALLLRGRNALLPAKDKEVGGWLSRSWLTGLVLPGESTTYFLISTLLENDPDAIKALGVTASLRQGFVYRGQSFWAKASIVARVLAVLPGAVEIMGWNNIPIIPEDQSGNPVKDGWVAFDVRDPPARDHPRIHDGEKVSHDSSVLALAGDGKRAAVEFSLPVDEPNPPSQPSINLISLSIRPPQAEKDKEPDNRTNGMAVLNFQVADFPVALRMPLMYDVYFLSAYPCRPPLGHIARSHAITPQTPSAMLFKKQTHHEHLPSHPLHWSHKFVHKYINDLLKEPDTPPPKFPPVAGGGVAAAGDGSGARLGSVSAPTPVLGMAGVVAYNRTAGLQQSSGLGDYEVWVIDARGERGREILVRTWCARWGRHAVVARVGRTCVGCAVREARAVGVGVVIRTGELNGQGGK